MSRRRIFQTAKSKKLQSGAKVTGDNVHPLVQYIKRRSQEVQNAIHASRQEDLHVDSYHASSRGATKNSNPAFSFVHKTLNYWPKFLHYTISTLNLQLRSHELLLLIITCTVLRVICLLGGLRKPLVINQIVGNNTNSLYKAVELQQVKSRRKTKIIYAIRIGRAQKVSTFVNSSYN